MAHTRTWSRDGSPSYRDKSFKDRPGYRIDNRFVEYGHSIDEIDEVGRKDRGDSIGDILGPVFFKARSAGTVIAGPISKTDIELGRTRALKKTAGRSVGSWFHGAPVIVTKPGLCLPIADKDYTPDFRYIPEVFGVPEGTEEPVEGDTGILYTACEESGPAHNIFLGGAAANKIIAANIKGSDFAQGTTVYDMEGDKPSERFKAKLQTTFRVIRPRFDHPGSKALESSGRAFQAGFKLGIFAEKGQPFYFLRSSSTRKLGVGLATFSGVGIGGPIGGDTPGVFKVGVGGFPGVGIGGPILGGASPGIAPVGTGGFSGVGAGVGITVGSAGIFPIDF